MLRKVTAFVALILASVALIRPSQVRGQDGLDFAHDVVPILQKHCIACHGGREAKGSFSMNHRELLVDSGHVVSGKPAESHLLELIQSTDKETQMPPSERPRVSADEQAVLSRWIAEGLVWDDGFSFAPRTYEPPLKPFRPDLPPAVDGRENPIDRVLDAYLIRQGIPRPDGIDDATFARRVSLDLVGLLPTPEELNSFVPDSSPTKRAELIRRLLEDKVAYADHWLTFFNDLLRNDYSGTGFITGGRQQVSAWLYAALVTNKPYDQFARELIAPPTPESQGYIDGIRWRGEVSAGQTNEIQFAQSVSQSFLGINLKCASCHDSFIDRWKLEEAYGLAAIYSSRPLEIHRCDKPIGTQAEAKWLFPELGQIDPTAAKEERLRQLAALMTHPENGRFSRTIVNRLWYKLMGRGIVHPLDAMQSEPWNADLLDVLANHLVDHHYDLKSVLFLIATSEAYQSKTIARNAEAKDAATGYVYRGPTARRMTAEQFLDCVWQITGAAPTTIDAPVFRGDVSPEAASRLELRGQWLWGDSAADGKAPPANETIAIRTKFTLADSVTQGGAIVTCDNSFTLFINNREVMKGTDWQQPSAVALKGILKKGDNTIVAIATNAGSTPNPAGLFFEARIQLADGSEQTISTDGNWQWSPAIPAVKEGRLGAQKGDWKPVVIVHPVDVWTQVISTKGRELLLQSVNGNARMVRASLVKNDFLMKSLGRPLREQIVSMRPDELTTLEAVDLSNGATLSGYLATGGRNLSESWSGHRDALVEYIFQFALSRNPAEAERGAIVEALSPDATPQEIEDLLWAVLMSPEFFLVR